MNKNKKNGLQAFTLTEVMVVLVIIGILMLIALPNLTGLFGKAHALEAQKQLQFLATLQETYYQTKAKYASDFTELGFTPPKTVQEESGDAKYTYEIIRADQSGFLAKATAVVDFDRDGILNIWQVTHDTKVTQTIPD